MQDIAILILCQIPSIICAVGAVYLASKSKEGWGWFLFLALLLAVSWKNK